MCFDKAKDAASLGLMLVVFLAWGLAWEYVEKVLQCRLFVRWYQYSKSIIKVVVKCKHLLCRFGIMLKLLNWNSTWFFRLDNFISTLFCILNMFYPPENRLCHWELTWIEEVAEYSLESGLEIFMNIIGMWIGFFDEVFHNMLPIHFCDAHFSTIRLNFVLCS